LFFCGFVIAFARVLKTPVLQIGYVNLLFLDLRNRRVLNHSVGIPQNKAVIDYGAYLPVFLEEGEYAVSLYGYTGCGGWETAMAIVRFPRFKIFAITFKHMTDLRAIATIFRYTVSSYFLKLFQLPIVHNRIITSILAITQLISQCDCAIFLASENFLCHNEVTSEVHYGL
jgi:hypothetical protein